MEGGESDRTRWCKRQGMIITSGIELLELLVTGHCWSLIGKPHMFLLLYLECDATNPTTSLNKMFDVVVVVVG